MHNRFFFVTTYDNLSAAFIEKILNSHPDFHSVANKNDMLSSQNNSAVDSENIDRYIENYAHKANKCNGDIGRFTAHELQHNILMQRTKHPLRKINLVINPALRINLLMHDWLENNIDKQLPLFKDNRFDILLKHIHASAKEKNVDINSFYNKLFLIALAKVVTQDYVDLLSSTNNIYLEKLIQDKSECDRLFHYLSENTLFVTPDTHHAIQEISQTITAINAKAWEPWQTELLDQFLYFNFQTIRFQHAYKPLAALYANEVPHKNVNKLISIHLNSNRPAQLASYFDNIEETTHDLSLIEVLVNCDDNDYAMQALLKREMTARKFTIKYITSPRPASFCDLWQPINSLLAITDPNAYFLLNISDEMLFATHGWDSILKKYVGFFPDHLFRLRASRNQFRNYFDRWECSFAQDAIPITTKKWVDIGGDWNPCFGPDSFQQLIAFYLAQEGKFSAQNYLRELPVIDIKLHGDIPSLGIDKAKLWKLNRDHINAMQICQSHTMQTEAKRRAMLLKAHIIANNNQITHFDVQDDKKKRVIRLLNTDSNKIIGTYSYKLSWLKISLVNQIRKLRFHAYFGGGKSYDKNTILGFAGYLKAKYTIFYKLFLLTIGEKS